MTSYPKFRLTLSSVNTDLFQFSYCKKPTEMQRGWWWFRLNKDESQKICFANVTYFEAVRAALVVANYRSALSIEVLP